MIAVMICVIVVLVAMGIPMAFALLAGSLLYVMVSDIYI